MSPQISRATGRMTGLSSLFLSWDPMLKCSSDEMSFEEIDLITHGLIEGLSKVDVKVIDWVVFHLRQITEGIDGLHDGAGRKRPIPVTHL